MKKVISLLVLASILISCLALAACDFNLDNIFGNSIVGIISTSDGSAEILKEKLEAKTGETVDIVTGNTDKEIVIYIKKKASSFDAYGWTVSEGRITLNHDVLTDFATLADAFVANVTTLESIKSLQTTSLKASAENNIYNATEEMLVSVDAKAEAIKSSVFGADKFDASTATGTVYYVSNSGNDSNDGKSPSSAWATLDKVNSASLSAGDAVLFECGSLFRGTITTAAGVTYASYGDGQMPIIVQSKRNYAQADLWELYDAEHNIWRLKEYVSDPGIIVFNAKLDSVDCYGEITATRLWNTDKDSSSRVPYSELLTTEDDLVYYWGSTTSTWSTFNQYDSSNTLYLRSEKNPNTDFDSIEIGEDKAMFKVGTNSDVTVDGICFKYGGGHCVSGSTFVEGLTVRNCVFAWIGGGLLNGASLSNQASRYGNAVEIFGGCDGFEVYNNWIYEIFDTGITFQYHYSSGTTKMVNINIYDNLVERSYWCLEWWISPNTGAQKNPEVSNVYVHDNILREGFDSWGTMHHTNPAWGAMLSSGFGTSNLFNFVIENNVFDRTFIADHPEIQTRMLNISIGSGNNNIEYKSNLFLQYTDQFLAKVSYSGTSNSFTGTRSKIKSFIKLMDQQGGVDMSSNFYCVVEKNK